MVLVLPAYNAGSTLERAVATVPAPYREAMIVVDDGSTDETYRRSIELGLTSIRHPSNRGYGGNQKTARRRSRPERRADHLTSLGGGAADRVNPGRHGRLKGASRLYDGRAGA